MKKLRTYGNEEKRNGLQTLICVICGVVGLASVVVALLTTLFGNLFVVSAMGLDFAVVYLPAISVHGVMPAEHYSLFTAVTTVPEWLPMMQAMIESLATTGSSPEALLQNLMPGSLSLVLIVVSAVVALLVALIATIIATIRFISGLLSKKYFSLARPVAWVLGANVSIYLACMFGSVSAWISPASAVFMNILFSALALGLCVIGNALYVGKDLLSLNSILKLGTNVCIFVGALIGVLLFPIAVIEGSTTAFSEPIVLFGNFMARLIGGAELIFPDFVYMIISLAMSIALIFALPAFLCKTSSRLASTFRFDGRESKGIVFRSVCNLIYLLMFIIPTALYVGTIGEAVAPGVFMLLSGGIICLVGAIVNKIFLNKE